MQTHILKIIFLFLISFHCAKAQSFTDKLTKADSLFKAKMYTQSFEIYDALLSVKYYSPAMLLKMAFIQEGLGHANQSLYYLNLYFNQTGDIQVLTKMKELASQSGLQGYDNIETDQYYYYLSRYSHYLSALLISLLIVLLATIYRLKKNQKNVIAAWVITFAIFIIMIVNVNFPISNASIIISDTNTYLMSGPSAGANVIGVVDVGHKLRVINKKDVWMEVMWMNKPVFVKADRTKSLAI